MLSCPAPFSSSSSRIVASISSIAFDVRSRAPPLAKFSTMERRPCAATAATAAATLCPCLSTWCEGEARLARDTTPVSRPLASFFASSPSPCARRRSSVSARRASCCPRCDSISARRACRGLFSCSKMWWISQRSRATGDVRQSTSEVTDSTSWPNCGLALRVHRYIRNPGARSSSTPATVTDDDCSGAVSVDRGGCVCVTRERRRRSSELPALITSIGLPSVTAVSRIDASTRPLAASTTNSPDDASCRRIHSTPWPWGSISMGHRRHVCRRAMFSSASAQPLSDLPRLADGCGFGPASAPTMPSSPSVAVTSSTRSPTHCSICTSETAPPPPTTHSLQGIPRSTRSGIQLSRTIR
eukprot:Opistho-2@25031